MKSIITLIIAIITISALPAITHAQNITQDIHKLCAAQASIASQTTCQANQQAALNEVKTYMNMIQTDADEYTLAQDPSFLSSLMSCLAHGAIDQNLTDYVAIDNCMKDFSLARAY